jgi:hypothetical protein
MAFFHPWLILLVSIGGGDSFSSFQSRWTSYSSRKLGATIGCDTKSPRTDTNDHGLEYVSLSHPSGAKSEVYLFGGVPTKYTDGSLPFFPPSQLL